MRFDEVREGDTVRTLEEFADGTVTSAEFTVTYAQSVIFGNQHTFVCAKKVGRKSLSIELVHRTAPPPKVGDLLTGAQVQALPNHAVFVDAYNKPRIVFGGAAYAPGPREGVSLYFHAYTEPTYRLIYLPEEDN